MKHKFTSELNKNILEADDDEKETKLAKTEPIPVKRPIDYHLMQILLNNDLRYKDIADKLRCSEASVKKYVQRIKKGD
jgi:DNA-binding NarL/FixJ family response regulator